MAGSCGKLVLVRPDRLQEVARHTTIARRWIDRAVGLLKYRLMPQGVALVFPACNSVHTIGMRFAIDLVFVDRRWAVVRADSSIPPGRVIWPVRGAWAVVELAAGTVQRMGLAVGDRLKVLAPTEDEAPLTNGRPIGYT